MNESTNSLAPIMNPDGASHLPTLQTFDEAAAATLLAISGGRLTDMRSAMEELTRRNKMLLEGGPDAMASALATQATLLETVILRLYASAAKPGNPKLTALALSNAMAAQRTLLQVLGALHQVQRAAA